MDSARAENKNDAPGKISNQPAACSKKQDSSQSGAGTLTYADNTAEIIKNRCLSCHQEGGIAPFTLASYGDVKKRASTIDAVIACGNMPPWKPSPDYGKFAGERCLSQGELNVLREWIRQGAAPGDLNKISSLPIQPANGTITTKWRSGQPDLIIKMPEPYKVKSDGPDIYRCFVFPLDLKENKFVSHIEFHPGNPKVVHHALLFLDNLQEARKKDEADKGPGFASAAGPGFLPTGSLGGWAPGNSMLPLPDGVARLLRKGSDLVVQVHYHPSGKEELAQSELGIYFSKEKPRKILLPLTVRSRAINIPAGEKRHKVTASTKIAADFDILQVTPHAHLLCRQIKSYAITPDGKNIPLIWIKNWDFNWQEQYAYKEPVHLPAGTELKAEFIYDNSQDNYANPNHPPRKVSWGEQTTDEMALIFYSGTVSRNEDSTKYIQGLVWGALKDMSLTGTKPANALKGIQLLLDGSMNANKILNDK